MRLTEAITGSRSSSRTTHIDGTAASGAVEVVGVDNVSAIVNSLLTTNPEMDRLVRKLINVATRDARNRVSKDIAGAIGNDPRKAARAVKHMVYKQLFGANISILSKRHASNSRATLVRQRQLDRTPHQRGGNRRPKSSRTKQLESYFGSDRGFVLRFLNSGTTQRMTKYGNRGAITGNNMFGHIAPWHMEKAVEEVSNAIIEYINKQANNG
jgi:hypothetical protein